MNCTPCIFTSLDCIDTTQALCIVVEFAVTGYVFMGPYSHEALYCAGSFPLPALYLHSAPDTGRLAEEGTPHILSVTEEAENPEQGGEEGYGVMV